MIERVLSPLLLDIEDRMTLLKCFADFCRRAGGDVTPEDMMGYLDRMPFVPLDTLMLVGRDGSGQIAGFLFASTRSDQWNPARVGCVVTAAYSRPDCDFREAGDMVEAWAKENGAERIGFQTRRDRKAMERLMGRRGYEASATLFRKDLR